jgi:hypothetical protein
LLRLLGWLLLRGSRPWQSSRRRGVRIEPQWAASALGPAFVPRGPASPTTMTKTHRDTIDSTNAFNFFIGTGSRRMRGTVK